MSDDTSAPSPTGDFVVNQQPDVQSMSASNSIPETTQCRGPSLDPHIGQSNDRDHPLNAPNQEGVPKEAHANGALPSELPVDIPALTSLLATDSCVSPPQGQLQRHKDSRSAHVVEMLRSYVVEAGNGSEIKVSALERQTSIDVTRNCAVRTEVPCPPCPTCPAFPETGEKTVTITQTAAQPIRSGPCSGQAFRCDECLNEWFCPPQETPAQPLPCGLGWACLHCSSSWFCIPGTVPAPNLPPPAPVPGPAATSADFSAAQTSNGEQASTKQDPAATNYENTASLPPSDVPTTEPETSEIVLFPTEASSAPLRSGSGEADPAPGDAGLQPQPDPTNALSQWKYIGCFHDSIYRTLTMAQPLDYLRGDMSAEICVNHCRGKGYPLAGTENSQERWCGRSVRPDSIRLPESSCEMPCQGFPGGTCGGSWTVSIFGEATTAERLGSAAYNHPPSRRLHKRGDISVRREHDERSACEVGQCG